MILVGVGGRGGTKQEEMKDAVPEAGNALEENNKSPKRVISRALHKFKVVP